MTIDISANNPRISYSVASGVTQTSFTVPFEFFDDSDLNVYIDTTLQTITTNYTVAGGAGSTGTITMSVTGPKTVILTRDTTIERTTDFTAGIDINRAALNTQLDTLTAISADNKDFAERSIRITDYDPAAANLLLPDAATRADKLLSFDTEGDVQVQAAADLLTGSVLGANYTKASYTGDGTQTAYSTVESAGSKNNIQVYVDGVYQNKATFSISSATLTFTEAPPLNSAIEFIVGNAVTSITGDASAITYNQSGTGAQERTVKSKLQESVSVKDFGAVGDGVTDDTAAIQAAVAASEKLYFPKGTYLFDVVNNIDHDLEIDFCGSTCHPPSGASNAAMFYFVSGANKISFSNGILDGQNQSSNFSHIINVNSSTCDFSMENMQLLNNCEGGATPVASRDIDLLYVNTANSVYINNCVFRLASRQGISFTGIAPNIVITNSIFEDCYLYGIDIEPNTSTSGMYENIKIDGCVFKNNGNKSTSDHVWGPSSGNGPFRAQSASLTVDVIKNISFTNNKIISTDFLNQVVGWQSPAFGVEQYNNLVLSGNTFQNINWVVAAGFSNASCPIYSTTISDNIMDTSVGDHGCQLLTYYSDKTTVSNNALKYLRIAAQDGFTVDGNTFVTTNSYGIEPVSGTANGVISNNTFDVGTYAISTASTTTGFSLVGNELNGATLTGPSANLDIVRVGNTDNIVNAQRRYEGDYSIISIDTATTTTVFNLSDTDKIGMIVVHDTAGTRIGSYALFGNFYDGSTNSSFLTNVQDSGVSGSALTLSGNLIQFTHTYGSTRNVSVNVVNFGE